MKTKITFFSLLAFLFFIPNVFGQCTGGSQYPAETYTPVYDGSLEIINTDCWAGEYAFVNILSTSVAHTFSSSTVSDYITITSADGLTVYASGTSPVVWTPTVTGIIRYYVHLNSSCSTQNSGRIRYIKTAVNSCGAPTALNALNITSNSAYIACTPPAASTISQYWVYLNTTGFAPISSTLGNANSTTPNILVNGLLANTTYFYWVKDVCTSGANSSWVAGGTFSTLAEINLSCNGAFYGLNPATTFTPAGTGNLELITNASAAGQFSYVNLSADKQYTFQSAIGTDYLTITNAAGTAVIVKGSSPLTWNSGAFSGLVRYFLHSQVACGISSSARSKFIKSVAACNAPNAIGVSGISSVSATLSWNASASGYQTYTSTTNTAPVDGLSTTPNYVTTNSNSLTGLTPATTYYFWVRSVCATGNSSWFAGGSFTTTGGGCNAGTLYPTATFTPACTGVAETITVDAWGGEYSNVNIVANKSYTFASSVATDYLTITNATGTVIYAYGTTPLIWSSGAITGAIRYFIHTNIGCGTENISRTRTIVCGNPCSAPSNLAALNITSNSVKFNWTLPAVQPSSGYQVYTSATNVAPLTTLAIEMNAPTSNQITFNGFDPNSTYYYWVRSVCGTSTSAWVAGGSFTTIPASVVGCNGATYGAWPFEVFTPACSGTAEVISLSTYAGEFSYVNTLDNKHYTFTSSEVTDYITITNDNGTIVYASGTTPLIWDSGSNSGIIRYHINLDAACGSEQIERTRSITCTETLPCLLNPSNLGSAYVTSNSANVFWTASSPTPASGYQVYASISNALPTANTQGNVNVAVGQNSAVVANLNADTIYYYYVRSNCGSGVGSWIAGGTFRTIPSLVCNGATYGLSPVATYTPSCSGNAEIIDATAWAGEFSRVNILSGRQYTFSSSVSTDYITITNAAGTTLYANATTPLLWNSGSATGEIRYYLHSDPNCGSQATNRVKSISCSLATSCTGISGINVNGITSSGGSVNWTSSVVPGNGFDYYISTSNAAPTAATSLINTTSNSVVFTNLPAATTFYYWIRSNCSNFQSAWTTGSFTTLFDGCITGTLFPSVAFTPACTGSLETISITALTGQYTNVNVVPNKIYTFGSSIPSDYITITNAAGTVVLDTDLQFAHWVSGSFTGVVRFYMHTNSSCGTSATTRQKYVSCQDACPSPTGVNFTNVTVDSVQLNWASGGSSYYYISTYNVTPTYSSDFIFGGSSNSVSKIVTGLSPNTTYYYWVRKFCSGGSSAFSAIVYGGSFTTLAEASCNPPTNVSVSNVTSNSAYFNFTSITPAPVNNYQYYVDTVNVTPTNTTVATGTFVNDNLSNITGLNPNQTYFYWIRSACSETSKSEWVAGGSFTTVSALSCNGTAGVFGLYPADTFTPSCSGTAELITFSSWAGEFTNINISTDKQYTFTSSVATDYITITNVTGNIVYASGTTPLNWYSGINSGVIRYFIHTDSSCGTEEVTRTRSIICAMPIISFVGEAASGWDTDIYLSSTDGIIYTLNNYTLSTGGLKFRQNSNWIINWGNATFPSGTGVQDGSNIPVVACNYNIDFNIVTGAYNFVSTSAQPVKPTGTATQSFCNSATLADLVVTGTNIKWYDFATGGSLLASNTTIINGSTYYASQSNGTCESIERLAVTVNINTTAVPTAAATQAFCNGATVANLIATGTALKWYNVPANGSVLSASTTLTNAVYYVTQTLNNCESARKAVTITINTNLTPTFTAVAPICSGTTLTALPVDSNNGINGSWSPALNNTATTTYTFTPAAGQCASTATLTITVNPNVTPTFTAVAPICSGATLTALPTTSNNGITGSWSPALNNTATTTYTFTPTAGQCATTRTLTITVNPNVTPTFSAVAPICSGATLTALPTTSNNGITGTWSPVLNNTATTTYTFTPTAGQCATTTNLTVTVNPNITPTFTAVAPICSGATLTALPTTSNNGITGTWSPALNNNATTTYTFTPTVGQCATTRTLTITVNPNVIPTFTAVTPICSGAILTSLPTTSNNGITGTWSPALNNTATTTYTFTPTVGQCATTRTLTITVNPNVTPTFTAVAPICSGATLTALPTTSNNGITGSWSPALNNTATTTYTFTPTVGQCATTRTLTITVNPNVTPTFTAVAPICSGATLTALPTTSNNGITGTWSPVLNNTATTTYTFTPTVGQCALPRTLTITVNPNVTPTFTAVAPICSGATLTALPTTSNNGITGTWSPVLNNTATTTYTFTPTVGQCALPRTLTITVNPNVTPTFTAVASICSGATLTALPTTSNNGITGTWSPVLNNTATTTYTFTPTVGQCATTRTLTITVNPNVTPTFTAVAPICSGATLTALPTTSNNGITGTWSPALNNTATTTYTFTPTVGQCASTRTLTITVNPNVTPTFSAVAPICSGATLTALPTTSNNGITGTWSPALNNTATTTYTFTPTVGQCALSSTLTITVNPNVTPTFTAVAPICSGATLTALPTTSNNGITGTWSPALNNTATTTYTFTPTVGQCALTTTLIITVNPNVTPTFTAVAPICSGATLTALPTTSNNGITGTWSPALNNTTTTIYTFTPTVGQCALSSTLTITVNPNVTPTFTAVAPICSGATLTALPTTSNNGITGTWSPALNNTATTTYTFTPTVGQCALETTLTITVNPNVTPTFTAIAPICSGATLTALPTTSNNGITGTWSPALNNTATTTYTFTPTAGQCALITTLTITVNPNVTPTFTTITPICSGATLTSLPTTSNNGITGTWSPVLNNTATTTYTFTPTAGQCALETTLTITVNPNVTPTFTAVAPICSGATLTELPTTSNNGITGTWSPALNNTATTTYTFTPTFGQCALATTLTITVNPNVTPTFTAVAPICSGATLTALPTTSNNGITGTWSPALNNTATTTYTFTPTVGQCAIATTLTITVNEAPIVLNFPDTSACISYVLPLLTNGNYFTGPNGTGSMLTDGAVLTNSQTVYIFADNGNCSAQSSFNITITATPVVDDLEDVQACEYYTLPQLIYGNYFTSPIGTGTMLTAGTIITASTTLYIFVESTNASCIGETDFSITINANPFVDTLENVTVCDAYTLPTLTNGNYYTASNGTGTALDAGTVISASQTVFVYASNGNCSAESSFEITITTTPLVDQLTDVTVCDAYTLPTLTNGNYYTASNGTGTALDSGTVILASQTVFVYATNGNCSAESSFAITITTTPLVDQLTDVTVCDAYTLPTLTNGNYYTASNGTGTALDAGTVISASQTLFVYASNGNCSAETSFAITITTTPMVDQLTDVTVCDAYTLPTLTNGNYYTASNGSGTALDAGTVISASQTVFVYASNGNCSAESSFEITITTTPLVDQLTDVTVCDAYTLPTLTNGNYYTASNGTGTALDAGTVISASQTLFVYASNGNCSAESSFAITITTTPLVDQLTDVTVCDAYTLPTLANGNYYTASNGTGTALDAGTVISASQTVFVYASNGNCSAESSFAITITTTPLVDQLTDVTVCDDYTLPTLTNGNYYTASNGTGTALAEGTVISTSQTLFVYASNGNCSAETSFAITIQPIDNTVSVNNATITANLSGASYQWFSCEGGLSPIAAATTQSFTATENGSYSVQITSSNCIEMSECVVIDTLDNIDFTLTNNLKMYPNPSQGLFIIETQNIVVDHITVIDNLGRTVRSSQPFSTKTIINIDEFADGVYYVRITYGNYNTTKKLILKR